MTDYINILLTVFALAIALISILLSFRTVVIMRSLTNNIYEIQDKLTGRSQFTKLSVHINRSVAAKRGLWVWHIGDTLSIDKDYYEFYYKSSRTLKKRITIFAPLELHAPILVGAILRKYLAPEITIRNIPKPTMNRLLASFPLKAVIGGNMVLVSNQIIGSRQGSAVCHFSASTYNPFADFVKKVYVEANIEEGEKLDEWIMRKCKEGGFDFKSAQIDKLRSFLLNEESINKYLEEFNPDYAVGRVDIDRAIVALAKRLGGVTSVGK
jgi:hypothetical protein